MGAKHLMQRRSGFRAATVIQFSSKYLNGALNLVVTMVLARILTPEDYGVVAMVSVFIGLFSLLTNMGIGPAVIQYRNLTDEDCSALMSFTLLLGIALALVFCALSWPMSMVFNRSEYVPLMCLSSLAVLFNSMNMVPNGVLVRDKRFFAIGIRLVVVSIVSGVVSIGLAFAGFGAYALVANSVIAAAGAFLWNFLASGLRLGNWAFRSQLKLVGRFSAFQFASQFVQYLIRNLDNFLVGVVLGTTALGFYEKAYRLAKYPVNFLPGTMNPVLKTFFADCGGVSERLYGSYFRVQKVLSILGVLASVACFFLAEELVLLLFGDQWVDSNIPFKILSLSIAFQVLNFSVFSVLEAAKRTDYLLAHTIITGCTTIGLLIVGLCQGDIVAVSAYVSLGFALSTVSKLYFVIHKAFQKSILSYILKFAPEFAAGVLVSVALVLVSPFISGNLIVSFLTKSCLVLALYFGLILLFGQGDYIRDIFKGRHTTSI